MALRVAEIVALGLMVIVLVAIAIRRAAVRRARKARFAHARAAETTAEKLLESFGYLIRGRQVHASYTVWVDGKPVDFQLRVDLWVEREGKTYVAEVKTGEKAPQVGNTNTRRQLLEYRVAMDADGILLVNGDEGTIQEVVFPLPEATGVSGRWSTTVFLTGIVVGAGLVVAILRMLAR